ncbi:MAG: FHIPEP family type III secretion protein, partial [Planctomycetota bacterium]
MLSTSLSSVVASSSDGKTTIYMSKPLDFSVFPSLLLATTMLRLVLNIASTRLILNADASSPEEAM